MPTNITHAVTGAALALSFGTAFGITDLKLGGELALFGAITSNLPDLIDVPLLEIPRRLLHRYNRSLSWKIGRKLGLKWCRFLRHRGVSHGAPTAPFQALVALAFFPHLASVIGHWNVFIVALASINLHLLLDYFNGGRGFSLAAPFHAKRKRAKTVLIPDVSIRVELLRGIAVESSIITGVLVSTNIWSAVFR